MKENLKQMNLQELEQRKIALEQEKQSFSYRLKTEEEQKAVQQEIEEIEDFQHRQANAIAFVSSTASLRLAGKDENGDWQFTLKSLLTAKEYAQLTNTLTENGNTKKEQQLLEKENFTAYEQEMILRSTEPLIFTCPEMKTALEEMQKEEYTVGDVLKAIEQSETMMEALEISPNQEKVLYDSREKLGNMFDDEKVQMVELEFVAPEKAEEKQKETEPVQITQTSDGYIQNTSRTMTVADMKQVETDYQVENGNEIHHEVPTETTHDVTKVSPTVHLEESGKPSTLEQETGISEKTNESIDYEYV